jgi:hypothetical protein
MAVDAGRYVGRRRRQDDRTAKARRQKQILVVAAAVLAVVLVVQLPGILHRRQGGSPASAGTVPAVPAPSEQGKAGGSVAATSAAFARRIALVQTFAAKDPFVGQENAAAATTASSTTQAHGPPVRSRRFVAKDPFAQQPDQGPTSAAPAQAAGPPVRVHDFVAKDPFAVQAADGGSATKGGRGGTPARAVTRKYIVILASIPVPAGYGDAARLARIARDRGIRGAGVLRSSSYGTLRPGFYVVYGSTFASTNGAARGLVAARAHGFPTAYTRPLGH